MAAYVICEVEVLDETQAARYRTWAHAAIVHHGGRYLVRGASPEVAEGVCPGSTRIVVVEFPTMEQLHRWYRSPEYAKALAVRQTALQRRLLFVDGVSPVDGVAP